MFEKSTGHKSNLRDLSSVVLPHFYPSLLMYTPTPSYVHTLFYPSLDLFRPPRLSDDTFRYGYFRPPSYQPSQSLVRRPNRSNSPSGV